jgi:hypothetical protein
MRLALSSLIWLLTCGVRISAQPTTPVQPPPTPGDPIIAAWLECDECRDGELEAVRKLGPSAVSRLASALNGGPSPARLQSYDKFLRKLYADVKARPKSDVPYAEDEFVKRERDRYISLYRVRAARALGEIGGPEAVKALDQALTLPLDPVVLARVKQARDRVK